MCPPGSGARRDWVRNGALHAVGRESVDECDHAGDINDVVALTSSRCPTPGQAPVPVRRKQQSRQQVPSPSPDPYRSHRGALCLGEHQ
jgi:hypothetical protein